MSRFFRGGDDSSSESSSDEEELYSTSEEEEEEDKEEQESSEEDDEEESSDEEEGPKKTGLSRFLVDQAESESDESEEEGATKVKSAKDKRFDELEATITTIQNRQKIDDWGSIANGMLSALVAGCPGILANYDSKSSTSSTGKSSSFKTAARLPSRTLSASPSWKTS
jgi:hypothetical protein